MARESLRFSGTKCHTPIANASVEGKQAFAITLFNTREGILYDMA